MWWTYVPSIRKRSIACQSPPSLGLLGGALLGTPRTIPVAATEQTRCAHHTRHLWGWDQLTKRLLAHKVRNRSNSSPGSTVPSCVEMKTSASMLHPGSTKMVSPFWDLNIPKSDSSSDKITQLRCYTLQKTLGVHSYPKWLLEEHSVPAESLMKITASQESF